MAMLGVAAMLTVAGCSISDVRVERANGDSTGVSGGRGEATIAGVKVEVEGLRETQSGINSGGKITKNADGATQIDTRQVRLGEVKLTFVRIDDAYRRAGCECSQPAVFFPVSASWIRRLLFVAMRLCSSLHCFCTNSSDGDLSDSSVGLFSLAAH